MKQLVNIWVQFDNGETRPYEFSIIGREPEEWGFPITRPRAATRIEFVEVAIPGGSRVQWHRTGNTTLFPKEGVAHDLPAGSYIKVKDHGRRKWQIWANIEGLAPRQRPEIGVDYPPYVAVMATFNNGAYRVRHFRPVEGRELYRLPCPKGATDIQRIEIAISNLAANSCRRVFVTKDGEARCWDAIAKREIGARTTYVLRRDGLYITLDSWLLQ